MGLGEDPKLELLKITNQAGLDEAAMDACLRRQEIVDVINANVKEANEVHKITGTPNFLLNGEKVELQRYTDLETAIYAALGETPPEETTSNDTPAAQTDTNASDANEGGTQEDGDDQH